MDLDVSTNLNKSIQKGEFQDVRDILDVSGVPPQDDTWEDFHILNEALKYGHKEIANLLIRRGCKRINITDEDFTDDTPLHHAVDTYDLELVQQLVSMGAWLDAENKKMETPIHRAGKHYLIRHEPELCKYLLGLHLEAASSNLQDRNGFSYFHVASACGDNDSINTYLDCNVDVNQKIRSGKRKGYTPLHFAVMYNRLDTVRLLLDNGASVELPNAVDNSTPLHMAFECQNKKITEELISRLDKNCSNLTNKRGISHFFIACTTNNTEIVQHFINDGAEICNYIDYADSIYKGYTPLHFSAQYGSIETTKLLLDTNPQCLFMDTAPVAPLHLAFRYGHNDIIDLLLKIYNTVYQCKSSRNTFDISHLHIACYRNNIENVKTLLKFNQALLQQRFWENSFVGYTPLHVAVEQQNIETIKLLLEDWAEIDARDSFGSTPLHLVCQGSQVGIKMLQRKLLKLIKAGDFDKVIDSIISASKQWKIIKLLMSSKNKNVNLVDNFGRTPLMETYNNKNNSIILSLYNNLDTRPLDKKRKKLGEIISLLNVRHKLLVQCLVDHGADLNQQDSSGQTVLHYLAKKNKNFVKIEKDLLKMYIAKGADVNLTDSTGHTPLYYAVWNGHKAIVDILLRHKADVNWPESKYTRSPLHAAVIAARSKQHKNVDDYVAIIESLIEHGADVYVRTNKGLTGLHLALLREGKDRGYFRPEPSTVNYRDRGSLARRIYRHFDVNVRDYQGMTALHYACLDQDVFMVPALLDAGADLNALDHKGRTPLTMCLDMKERLCIHYFFVNHVKKLERISAPLIDKNLQAYHELQNSEYKKFCLVKLQSILDVCDFHYVTDDECNEEIEKMMSVRIDDFARLYDLIFMSSNQLVRYMENDTLRQILSDKNLTKKYPLYGYLLKLQHTKGKERLQLVKFVAPYLIKLIGAELPKNCYDTIIYHLSDESLLYLYDCKESQVLTECKIKILS
ncbi:serine/threonine-protein phosphatase 6 regulatory ankyrin repeat subunit B-like [Trichogramma pretiosum]|uniref:serine/threonine-protein phosphatase 6 regulatory ankyrin repeat subunit B-like n=1 Tax=Trichogramma pretiosum TaxID=7493 RepID=UPI0006C97361|nr:serine/threonine-protein phosphatase 6 regulatory ankyrin repeat subunit B-like [Trichogramma pretiosum]